MIEGFRKRWKIRSHCKYFQFSALLHMTEVLSPLGIANTPKVLLFHAKKRLLFDKKVSSLQKVYYDIFWRFCQCHSPMQKLNYQIVLHFCVTFLSSTFTISFKQLTGTFCRPQPENILISFAVIDLFLVFGHIYWGKIPHL